jgi:hypothetical protein
MKIVSYHVPSNPVDTCILKYNGQNSTGSNLKFFLDSSDFETIAVFRHLDYDVAGLLKMLNLTDSQLIELFETKKLYVSPYTLEYVPNKYFSIRLGWQKGAQFVNFSNMHQYMQYEISEENSVEIAKETGETVCKVLTELELSPRSLVSPIRAWEKEILANLDLPTVADIPNQAAEFAYKCTHGGWVEGFQKGHWIESYDYDVRSAYGYFTAQLLDTRQGKWIHSKDYQPGAYYGYCDGIVTIDSGFSPILFSKDNEQHFTPVGTWNTFLTKEEIDFIREYKIGSFEIADGWWWIPEDELVYPLEDMIGWLYEQKEMRSGLERDVVKRIIAGIWGKFLEARGEKIGKYFNPVWGAEVESRTRLATAKFVLDNKLEDDLLHVAVDGVLTSRPVELVDNSKMGDWKLSTTGACFVVSSGVVAIDGKNGVGDFTLRYDWLMDKILDKPDAGEYIMTKPSVVTLGKARVTNHLDQIGQMTDITKAVDVEYELKRSYPEYPKTGRELLRNKYKSIPWDISVIIDK